MRPEWRNNDVFYWRQLFSSANCARKEGWRRHYEDEERGDRGMVMIRHIYRNVPAEAAAAIPEHIRTEYRRLITQLDSSKRECAICMEAMLFDDSELTECGHMFHTRCLQAALDRRDVCPLCRNRNPIRKWSVSQVGAATATAQAQAQEQAADVIQVQEQVEEAQEQAEDAQVQSVVAAAVAADAAEAQAQAQADESEQGRPHMEALDDFTPNEVPTEEPTAEEGEIDCMQ